MIKKKFLIPAICFLTLFMSGTKVYPDVISAGGTEVTAADGSYTLKFTLGQSTPVSDPLKAPSPDSQELKPGFWYTTTAKCVDEFDSDTDEDVDGKDVAAFAAALAGDAALAAKLNLLAQSFAGYGCE